MQNINEKLKNAKLNRTKLKIKYRKPKKTLLH